jgi:hypothetical protein
LLIAERPPKYSGHDRGAIPEKLLARLWRQRAARQEGFRTAAGLLVRVVYPGREGGPGPDFKDAILEMEGQGLVRGDVELHVRQRDWSSHGHTQDPNYNGVVLHAALEVESDSTGLHSGGNAPVVSLASLLDEADHPDQEPGAGEDDQAGVSGNLWNLLEPLGYPCPATKAQAGELLDRTGDQRFQARVREFAVLVEETRLAGDSRDSGDQVLYEGLMEGLGYKANRQGFLSLANRTPWRRLVELTAGLSEEQAFLAVRGWMLQVSGLNRNPANPGVGEKLPSGIGPALGPGDWRLSGLRPANHPLRRMAGAAGLVQQFRKVGLTAGLRTICDANDHRKLTKALIKPAEAGSGGAVIGQGRARDLAVNVVLPFLQAADLQTAGLKTPQPDAVDRAAGAVAPEAFYEGRYWELYRAFGKLQDNDVTKEMARLLLPPDWRPVANSARRQQGLIRLHRLLAGQS